MEHVHYKQSVFYVFEVTTLADGDRASALLAARLPGALAFQPQRWTNRPGAGTFQHTETETVNEETEEKGGMILEVVSKGSYKSNLMHMDVGCVYRLAQHDLHVPEQILTDWCNIVALTPAFLIKLDAAPAA
eukprot:1137015-Pelagomonas_calceolata.AAC.8